MPGGGPSIKAPGRSFSGDHDVGTLAEGAQPLDVRVHLLQRGDVGRVEQSAAYTRLEFAEGDPERAARLEGAAEGLRKRVGLRAWPMLRQGEAELVTQIRQTLDARRFNQAFSAGTQLSQREAVAAVRDRSGRGTALRRPRPNAASSQPAV
jgi:hypothetical protein